MSVDSNGPGEGGFLNGKLLIAMPGIADPRFERAVILVCLHAPEQAMGVRINAPHDDMRLDDILDKLGVEGRARDTRQAVLKGGPVERDRGYVLHSDDYEVEGSTLAVSEGLCLTATREILNTLTVGHETPSRAVLALGYAGWGPGQLEVELRENVWLTGPADADLVFDADHETKWDRALARMGISASMLSGQAGRARRRDVSRETRPILSLYAVVFQRKTARSRGDNSGGTAVITGVEQR